MPSAKCPECGKRKLYRTARKIGNSVKYRWICEACGHVEE